MRVDKLSKVAKFKGARRRLIAISRRIGDIHSRPEKNEASFSARADATGRMPYREDVAMAETQGNDDGAKLDLSQPDDFDTDVDDAEEFDEDDFDDDFDDDFESEIEDEEFGDDDYDVDDFEDD